MKRNLFFAFCLSISTASIYADTILKPIDSDAHTISANRRADLLFTCLDIVAMQKSTLPYYQSIIKRMNDLKSEIQSMPDEDKAFYRYVNQNVLTSLTAIQNLSTICERTTKRHVNQ